MENNKAERVRTYWYVINELFTVPYLPNPRYEKEHFIKIYADETNNNKYKLLKLPEDKIIKGSHTIMDQSGCFLGSLSCRDRFFG